MKSGRFFVSVLLLGNLGVLGAMSLHVVHSPQAFVSIVPKSQLTLVDTYVDLTDAQKWTAEQWTHHAVFMESLAEAGKGNLVEPQTEMCPACGAHQSCPADVKPAAQPVAAPAAQPKTAQPSAAGAVHAAPATQPAAQTPVHAPKSIFDFGDN